MIIKNDLNPLNIYSDTARIKWMLHEFV